MTTQEIETRIAEIRRAINSCSNQSQITALIIERDDLQQKLQKIKNNLSVEDTFEAMRNAMLY